MVESNINNTDDPNTTQLPRIRTKHVNCPTADHEYVINTTFIDDKNKEISERHQSAESFYNERYFRSKRYDNPWSEWKRYATHGELENTLSYESNNSDIKIFCATSVNGGFFEVDVNTNEKYQLLFQTTQKKILARYFDGEQWNDQVVASWS